MVFRIAPFGRTMIVLGLIVTAASWFSAHVFNLAAVGLLFTLFAVYFFRDPDIEITEDASVVLSPAEGTVLTIQQEGPAAVSTIRIFLSVFNIHVQRSPVSGKVKKITYVEGAFAVASAPEATRNERNVMTIAGPQGEFGVEQIAGLIARRIECYVQEGEEVRQGQRLGIIYFGSQVAVHLPAGWKAEVRPGDKVLLGRTVLARKA